MKKHELDLLVITDAYPFGKDYRGVFVKTYIEAIKKNFRDITVISPLAYFPRVMLNLDRFRQYSGYTVYPNNFSSENIEVFFPRYFPLPANDFFMQIRGTLGLFATEKIIRKEKIDFDLIHAHFIYPSGYIGVKLKEKYHKPLIITAHGGDVYYQPFKNSEWLRMTKYILKQSDKITTTSTRNYEIITKQLGIPKEKVEIIRNVVNKKLFFPTEKRVVRDRLSLSKNVKIILSIGNLLEIKGHNYLIEAMQNLAPIYNNLLCIIVGKGDKSKLQAQIERLGLTKFVKIVGGIPHEEIPLWMNACDLFVLPSLDEGFPTVIAEAMACGIPVLTTPVGGIPDIIEDGITGFIMENNSPECIAKNIVRALTHPDLERIAKNERELVEKEFTFEKICRKIQKILEDIEVI